MHNIIEKEFVETKIASKMSWDILNASIENDVIEISVFLENDIGDTVKSYFKRYTLSDFLNKEGILQRIYEDCEISPQV